MYKVSVQSKFSAAHFLYNYKGKCENLHGHNWKVFASIFRKRLDSKGMVIDFKEFKKKLNEVLKTLDHSYLNEIDYFKKKNTTSENIAEYIHKQLKIRLKSIDYDRLEVTVWETEDSSATFFEK